MRIGLALCTCLATLAGCAATSTNDSGARLPTGVTLLRSEKDSCTGVVHVDKGARNDEIVVKSGQNASFRVDSDRVGWTCIGESKAQSDRLNCPDRTSYVRITRPANDDDFLVECYGRES
ncbi:MAG TPA: hypothetical protein VFJ95_07855 [Gammaproteobacteria bacterium]|nr:hypothetical protein [Gammaproteobacteria bacterium]